MKYLAIIGSRDYPIKDIQYVINELCLWLLQRQRMIERGQLPPICIVSGAGGNVDITAENMAKKWVLPYLIFPADWPMYDNYAGPTRNGYIATVAQAAVAFCRNPQHPSKGTANCLSQFKDLGKPTMTFTHEQLDLVKMFIDIFQNT